ncbi:rab GTPase-activating protein 1-like,-like [Scleropages formosus]|uniref:Rab GTPase-activating protein 1-like,-like n=1 Tax=Scleropages formosus TaxID=113540 RepID=A0A0P7X191_SCLFO|nr:rab GTPase-activating protein 1-like,-like [Scleropages formosus]
MIIAFTFEVENRRLHEASIRLEQENDDLAQKVVTGKITLRSSLDQVGTSPSLCTTYAEDEVDTLSRELQRTKEHLVQVEDEKRKQQEETTQLKHIFRRELEKAESELKKTNAIIDEYKQVERSHQRSLNSSVLAVKSWDKPVSAKCPAEIITRTSFTLPGCSVRPRCPVSLGSVRSPDRLHLLQRKAMGCDRCRRVFGRNDSMRPQRAGLDVEKESLKAQLRELETELAQAKLRFVEAQCEIQVWPPQQ